MPNKKQLLDSMVAIAKKLRRTPSLMEFVARAKISKHSVFRFFSRWNEAVRSAGLEPCRLYKRPKDSELLEDWGKVVRKRGCLPSHRVYRLEGQYYPRTLEKRFGGWPLLPEAFRSFAKGSRKWADVLGLLPDSPPKQSERSKKNDSPPILPGRTARAPFRDRPIYGDLLHLPRFRHEPVNEQGVVLLFGMLAKDLGYMIEATQKGFPDCEAKRRIGADRWQRVRIEFEYESRNYYEHGHPVDGCDVIVCWRHNWNECPKHIEVVELSSIIKSLASSER